jgi:hypothetical protein
MENIQNITNSETTGGEDGNERQIHRRAKRGESKRFRERWQYQKEEFSLKLMFKAAWVTAALAGMAALLFYAWWEWQELRG